MMIVAFSKVGLAAFRPSAARNFTNVKLGFSCAPDFARRLFSTRHPHSSVYTTLRLPPYHDGQPNINCHLPQENELRSLHEHWMAEYGRVYKTPEEKEMSFQLFKDTVAYVSGKNPAAAVPELLEHLNGLADYADKEFKLMCGGIPIIRHPQYYKRQP